MIKNKIICLVAILVLLGTFLVGCSTPVVPDYTSKWQNTETETIEYSVSYRKNSDGSKYQYPQYNITIPPVNSEGTYTTTINRVDVEENNKTYTKHTVTTSLSLRESYYLAGFAITNEQAFLNEFNCVNPEISIVDNEKIVTFNMTVNTTAVFLDKPFGQMISSSRITKSVYAYTINGVNSFQLNNFTATAKYNEADIEYTLNGEKSTIKYSGSIIDNEMLLVYVRCIDIDDFNKVSSVTPIQFFNLNTGSIANLTFTLASYKATDNVSIGDKKYTTSVVNISLANADYTGATISLYLNGDGDVVSSGRGNIERNIMVRLYQDHLEFNLV